MNPPEEARSALSRALLAYVLLAIVLMTWAPFRFIWPRAVEIMWRFPLFDVVANIALFVPVGFLLCASGISTNPRSKPRRWEKAVLFGVIFSVVIEVGQIFLVERYTSFWDVLWNGLGTMVGAFVHSRLATVLSRFLPDHPTFELPMMNIVYLATIAMWFNGFASVEEPLRPLLGPLLAVIGVIVIAAVWRYRLAAVFTRHQATLGVLAWYIVAAAPSVVTSPVVVAASAVGVVILAWILTGLRGPIDSDERRFEHPTLRQVAIPIALYLVFLALWPLPFQLGTLEVVFHLPRLSPDPTIPLIFGILEHHAAFTILGFIVAEMRGRIDESILKTLGWVLAASLFSSFAFQTLQGLHHGLHASVIEAITTVLAAVTGGLLYRVQLAFVRQWIASGDRSTVDVSVDDLLDRFNEK